MLANVTAGISVGKQGTATVAQAELLNALHADALASTDRKVRELEEARRRSRHGARKACASASPMAAST